MIQNGTDNPDAVYLYPNLDSQTGLTLMAVSPERTLIARFNDGSVLEFGEGAFDGWCVYLTRPDVARHAPKDTDYFDTLVALSRAHGLERVYDDFVRVYDATGRHIDERVLDEVRRISRAYGDDRLEFSITMLTIYAGMIAEENKDHARLGKRVKRLGVHQVLHLNMPVEVAANFSRGKPWRDIARHCETLGF